MDNIEKNLDEQMEFGFVPVPEKKVEEVRPVETAVDTGEIRPRVFQHEDAGERDCPACGGSGPCNSCERGRVVMAEFKEAARKAKE